MITPFGLRHIGLVRELEGTSVLLDPKSALLEAPLTPLQAALRAYVLRSFGTLTYVLHAPDGAAWSGFVQAQAFKSGLAWKIARLAPALDSSDDAATIWYRLLLHLCIAAGERHVQRLFACVPQDSPAEEAFRQANFTVYCHERVFECGDRMAHGRRSARMSLVQPEDYWDVQRLAYRTKPQSVAQVEQLGDTRSAPQSIDLLTPGSQQGYLLRAPDGEAIGYLEVAAAPRGSCLRLIVHPDLRDGTAEMLDHALAVLRPGTPARGVGGEAPSRPVYCAVREYEGGIQALLEEREFSFVGACSLVAKHTTVHVRAPQRKLVPALEKRAGVAPSVSHSESGGRW